MGHVYHTFSPLGAGITGEGGADRLKGQREWLSAVKWHLLHLLVMNGIDILYINPHAMTAFIDLHKINRPIFQHEWNGAPVFS